MIQKNIFTLILLIMPLFMTAEETSYNEGSLEKIYNELYNCIPDSIKNRINIIDENDFMRGFIHSSNIRKADVDYVYKFFDCRKEVIKKIISTPTSCQEIFPDKMCGNSYIDYLVYKGLYYRTLNYPFDMQHAVDSIMNELCVLDSINAYRSVADTLHDVYIPKSIEEALDILVKSLKPENIKEIKTLSEDDFAGKEHHNLGLSIRNSWSLWGRSRFQRYLDALSDGIDHPDDQSTLILILLHRKINGKPLDKWKLFEEQKKNIKLNKEKWEKVKNR